VLKTVLRALAFMTRSEQRKYFWLITSRSLAGIFDLLGVLAIGFLATSVALFVTLGSDSSRVIKFGEIVVPAVSARTLPIVATGILILFVVKAVVSIVLTRKLAYFLALIEARAARKVAEFAFDSDLGKARRFSREDIYFAIQVGSPSAFNAILNHAGTILAEGLLFVIVLFTFFVISPFLAFLTLTYFALVALLVQYFIGNRIQLAGEIVTQSSIKANQNIGDLSDVLREATILSKTGFFLERIYDARIRAASSSASQFVLFGMPRYVVETALIVAVSLFTLIQAAIGDLVSAAGTTAVFLSGGLRLTASLLPLQSSLIAIKQSIPPAEKALDLLSVEVQGHAERNLLPTLELGNALSVDLQNVSFTYPASESSAIENVTIKVKPGQQVALIGPSGSGKSTIADLILGMLEPSSGKILVGGGPPRHLIHSFPGLLGYVPQRPGVIDGNISENIALGEERTEVNRTRLMDAVSHAHLDDVIDSLPEGLDTYMGKRKDELSGGQLQRIGLARALYTKPRLLVLDEATSALDAESENQINKALDQMRGSVTVVLIAHRLNTIQRSDVVYLIENGKVTDSGTFQELVKSNTTVQNLADLMSIESEGEF
jgi:ATP-binding cassette, subfamily B, bacterial PglK